MKDFQDRYSPMFRAAARDPGHCPPAGSLAVLAAGRAWPWQRRRLVDHLSHCSDCADDYRVLTAARGGLVTALEDQVHAGEGFAAGWVRPGLAVAATMAVVALGVSVLVETDAPTERGMLFASEFEPGPRSTPSNAQPERLFTSDFGEPEGKGGPLFRDDFGS